MEPSVRQNTGRGGLGSVSPRPLTVLPEMSGQISRIAALVGTGSVFLLVFDIIQYFSDIEDRTVPVWRTVRPLDQV